MTATEWPTRYARRPLVPITYAILGFALIGRTFPTETQQRIGSILLAISTNGPPAIWNWHLLGCVRCQNAIMRGPVAPNF